MCFRTGVQLPSSPPYRQKEQAPFRFRFTAKTALCLLLLPCLILNGVFLIPDYLFLFRVEDVHDLIEAGCFPVKLRLPANGSAIIFYEFATGIHLFLIAG